MIMVRIPGRAVSVVHRERIRAAGGLHRAAFPIAAKAMRQGHKRELKDSLIFLVMGWHRE
jgi:hypothetical protein